MAPALPPSWTTGSPPNAFAARPAGRLGRLGGLLRRALNGDQQREVLELLGSVPGDVVEIGPGPGVLLSLLAERPGVTSATGVEPSAEMRKLAARSVRGRAALRAGDAGATGLPDASADLVVSVNTVAIWPDLDRGVAELRRVLRPGGRLVLSWHGGREPSRAQRRLVLPEHQLARIEDAVRARFGAGTRVLTRRCTVFVATR